MTLTEIMITLVIISILGTFAMTTYVKAYEKSRGYQAVTVLRMIRTAERLYYLDWNTYTNLPNNACNSPLVTEGYMQCPNAVDPQERGFDYEVVALGNIYLARTSRTGTGRYTGKRILMTVSCFPCPETITWAGDWPWRPN